MNSKQHWQSTYSLVFSPHAIGFPCRLNLNSTKFHLLELSSSTPTSHCSLNHYYPSKAVKNSLILWNKIIYILLLMISTKVFSTHLTVQRVTTSSTENIYKNKKQTVVDIPCNSGFSCNFQQRIVLVLEEYLCVSDLPFGLLWYLRYDSLANIWVLKFIYWYCS